MFYFVQILRQNGPPGNIRTMSNLGVRNVSKKKIFEFNIVQSIEQILNTVAPLRLRLNGQLLLDISRIYRKKVICHEKEVERIYNLVRQVIVNVRQSEKGTIADDHIFQDTELNSTESHFHVNNKKIQTSQDSMGVELNDMYMEIIDLNSLKLDFDSIDLSECYKSLSTSIVPTRCGKTFIREEITTPVQYEVSVEIELVHTLQGQSCQKKLSLDKRPSSNSFTDMKRCKTSPTKKRYVAACVSITACEKDIIGIKPVQPPRESTEGWKPTVVDRKSTRASVFSLAQQPNGGLPNIRHKNMGLDKVHSGKRCRKTAIRQLPQLYKLDFNPFTKDPTTLSVEKGKSGVQYRFLVLPWQSQKSKTWVHTKDQPSIGVKTNLKHRRTKEVSLNPNQLGNDSVDFVRLLVGRDPLAVQLMAKRKKRTKKVAGVFQILDEVSISVHKDGYQMIEQKNSTPDLKHSYFCIYTRT